MKIEFLGGVRTVTGSCFIIKDNDFTIMIDCGMFQGKSEYRERNYLHHIYAPKKIDALLLTHAHIDHSGMIPRFVKNGFNGKIYATKPTVDLCAVMLPDSAHIQEMDVKWQNKKNKKLGRSAIEPLYTVDDANACLKYFIPVPYNEKISIHPRVEVVFHDAGHILGSSFIEMIIDHGGKKTKIVFSGDLGPKGQAIIKDPEIIADADVLLIESTYGDRLHKSKEDTYTEFKQILSESLHKKGNILIPAFAIERTQEIIYTLAKLFKSHEIPPIPVYIDSPLAISATEIFKQNIQCFDEETRDILNSNDNPLEFPGLSYIKTTEESKRLNDTAKGAIIIAGSGMCTAGRIIHHLQNNLYKPESSVIFVGFQAEGTLGRRLIEGAKQVKIYGVDVAVNATIHTLGGFSAHADKNGLIEWIGAIKNDKLKIFIVHGEESASLTFGEYVRSQLSHSVHVPEWGEIVDLLTMRSEIASYGANNSYSSLDREIEALNESVKILNEKYARAKSVKRIGELKKLQDEINDAREMLGMIIDDL